MKLLEGENGCRAPDGTLRPSFGTRDNAQNRPLTQGHIDGTGRDSVRSGSVSLPSMGQVQSKQPDIFRQKCCPGPALVEV